MCEVLELGNLVSHATRPGTWPRAAMSPTSSTSSPRRRNRLDPGVTLSGPNPVRTVRKGWGTVSLAWRVLVVDNNPTLLKIAARLLTSIPGIELVGEATSGRSALEAVDRLRPDLVLMDLAMPEMNGLEATRRLVARPDAPAVIIMTAYDLPQYRDAALAVGARHFIAKSDLGEQLLPAVLSLRHDFEAGGN
jgi:CheY-like chemotaxis protein